MKALAFLAGTAATLVTAGCSIDLDGGPDRPPPQPDVARIGSCLGRAGIMLRTDARVPGGGRERRGSYQPPGTRYRGAVYWRNGHVADLWTATSEDAASSAESELETAFSKFAKGSGSEKIVKRGLVLYALDDFAPPTAREVAVMERCL